MIYSFNTIWDDFEHYALIDFPDEKIEIMSFQVKTNSKNLVYSKPTYSKK